MSTPLKRSASTIILSKDIDKYAFMCGSNFYESDVILAFSISLENFYFVEKPNKENFVKKFVDLGIVKTCDEVDLRF